MAIVASFTSDITFGTGSITVNFTDTSTGSPTNWIWDFGDGSFSDEQHPSHTFDSSASVTLTAYILSSKVFRNTVQETTFIQKTSSTFTTTAAAFADFSATAYNGPHATSGALKSWYFSDGTGTVETPTYSASTRQAKGTLSIPAAAGPGPSHFILEFALTQIDSALVEGTLTTSLGGLYDAAGPTGQFMSVDGMDGQEIEFIPNLVFITTTPPQEPFEQAGVGASGNVYEIKVGSEDNTDTTILVNYITIDWEPDFVGVPLIGTSPLEVQFTDLSTLDVTDYATSTWDFGDGRRITVAGQTDPVNTYVSIDI